MEARALLALRKRSREIKVDLEDGKSVTITRPPENDMPALMSGTGEQRTFAVDIQHVRKYVIGWKGFTEADFLEAGVGGSDPVEFDLDLWDDLCTDNIVWTQKVGRAIVDAVVKHFQSKDAVAKNSAPA